MVRLLEDHRMARDNAVIVWMPWEFRTPYIFREALLKSSVPELKERCHSAWHLGRMYISGNIVLEFWSRPGMSYIVSRRPFKSAKLVSWVAMEAAQVVWAWVGNFDMEYDLTGLLESVRIQNRMRKESVEAWLLLVEAPQLFSCNCSICGEECLLLMPYQ